ncbi:MAG: L-rhamnose mutarotase [Proteobacteria bacterium]|nr:L-rhamnose mutarotase [Pseudomonadota bacterium]
MRLQRHCYALDLKDDPALIAEYKAHHEQIWPEIADSIRQAGIVEMQIFLVENRLFMIVEADDSFSPRAVSFPGEVPSPSAVSSPGVVPAADASHRKVREWETLMWRYQQPLPKAEPGEKWRRMEKIFELGSQPMRS